MPVIIYTPTPSSAPPSAPASAAITQHQGLADYPARSGLLKLATAQPKLKRKGKGKGKGKEEKRRKRGEKREKLERLIRRIKYTTREYLRIPTLASFFTFLDG